MTKQDPASTYTTAKFMSELSGIPMNYEYPTLNSMSILLNTNHQKKVIFPAAYKVVIRRYSRILFREQPLRPERNCG
jgi:hypothetical protein